MRIETPREAERFGANLFYGVQKVYELDSGMRMDMNGSASGVIRNIPYEVLHDIEQKMVIVVPVRNERIKLIEGVLSGIPNQCLIVLVSNSTREPVDRFSMEVAAIQNFCKFTQRDVLIIHQKDPVLAEAFANAGYHHLLNKKKGSVAIKDGKAEGMILATLLAYFTGRNYVGFIDSDNYFPGAVLEYVRAYAAGMSMSESDYSMVRINWHSKPKIVDSHLYFAKWGRASVVTNSFINSLISQYTGFETEVIKTGNAGEHAISMDLAMTLDYSAGYSIEPYHFINMLERFGGVLERLPQDIIRQQVEVFQIESRNPHLHEDKGDEHVGSMIHAALAVIYHSPLCPEPLKKEIVRELKHRKLLDKGEEPGRRTYYPALRTLDLNAFWETIRGEPYANLLQYRALQPVIHTPNAE